MTSDFLRPRPGSGSSFGSFLSGKVEYFILAPSYFPCPVSGPIDKISWLAEIFISLQGGRVLLVWSLVSGGPKQSVGCWSCASPPVVLVWSASRVQLLFTVISPGGVWLEDLSQHSLTFLTQHSQLQASLCGLGLISALRSSVADWDLDLD